MSSSRERNARSEQRSGIDGGGRVRRGSGLPLIALNQERGSGSVERNDDDDRGMEGGVRGKVKRWGSQEYLYLLI